MKKVLILTAALLTLAVFSMIGCGGGGGGSTAAPEVKYTISGAVTGNVLSDVTITLTGDATGTTTTDASGSYNFTKLANGSYTVTPSLAGYIFNPTNASVTVNGANATVTDFVATAVYTISGAITGAVQAGVTVTLSGNVSASTTTGTNGKYSFSDLENGSYTVTPSLAGYTFSPTNASVNVSGADVTGKDFVATAVVPKWSFSGQGTTVHACAGGMDS